jgi:hypothetical protein
LNKLKALLQSKPALRSAAAAQLKEMMTVEKDLGSVREFDTYKKAKEHLSADKAHALFMIANPDNLLDDKNDMVGGAEDQIRPALRKTLMRKFSRVTKRSHKGD